MPVSPSVVRCLRVAVGTKELEVLEPVVGAIAVDVMKRHVQRLASPLRDPTALASIFLQAFLDESALQMAPRGLPAHDEKVLDRNQMGSRHDVAAADRATPRRPRKAEAGAALKGPEPAVMSLLHPSP